MIKLIKTKCWIDILYSHMNKIFLYYAKLRWKVDYNTVKIIINVWQTSIQIRYNGHLKIMTHVITKVWNKLKDFIQKKIIVKIINNYYLTDNGV